MWWVILRYCDVSDKRTSNICPSVNPALRATSGRNPTYLQSGRNIQFAAHMPVGVATLVPPSTPACPPKKKADHIASTLFNRRRSEKEEQLDNM